MTYHSFGHLDSKDTEGTDTGESYNLNANQRIRICPFSRLASPGFRFARLIAEYAVTPAQLMGAA